VGGRLCLSGLRLEHIVAIQREYTKYGIDFDQQATRTLENWRLGSEGEGEWAQISGTKRELSDQERRALSAYLSAFAAGEGAE
jgi:cytochrome c553